MFNNVDKDNIGYVSIYKKFWKRKTEKKKKRQKLDQNY